MEQYAITVGARGYYAATGGGGPHPFTVVTDPNQASTFTHPGAAEPHAQTLRNTYLILGAPDIAHTVAVVTREVTYSPWAVLGDPIDEPQTERTTP